MKYLLTSLAAIFGYYFLVTLHAINIDLVATLP